MSNLLLKWLETARTRMEGLGYTVSYKDAIASGSCVSVKLDGSEFLGGICHWPPDLFEFQFHDASSGEVVVLETLRFDDVESLCSHVDRLIKDRLRRKGLPLEDSGRSTLPGHSAISRRRPNGD